MEESLIIVHNIYFGHIFGTFGPKSPKREFSWKSVLGQFLSMRNIRKILMQNLELLLIMSIMWPKITKKANFGQNWSFPEKSGSVTFLSLWTLTSCRISEKLMSQFWEKFQTNRILDECQWFHRTFSVLRPEVQKREHCDVLQIKL